ncbi:MAG: hypothetical protein K8T25_00290 [Planctomycetia bacterium]|nr:hypothetical protein [Planctomycetia bacterium]
MRSQSMKRAGFTRIELFGAVLFIVIVIAILISVMSVAVVGPGGAGPAAFLFAEEQQMTMALQQAMNDYGTKTYPPADLRMKSAADLNAPVAQYFQKIFPQYNIKNLYADLRAAGVNTANFDPGEALVFWLVGFDPDTTNPLRGHDARMKGLDTTRQLYAFKRELLVKNHYLYTGDTLCDGPSFTNSATQKYRGYLYFDNDSGAYGLDFRGFHPYCDGPRGASPFNPTTCQIICAGRDQLLGTGGVTVNASGAYSRFDTYRGTDADNAANFGGGMDMQIYMEKLRNP